MNFSPKLDSFQKNEGLIRIEWRQIYSLELNQREYNNFFQFGMVPLTRALEGRGANALPSGFSRIAEKRRHFFSTC